MHNLRATPKRYRRTSGNAPALLLRAKGGSAAGKVSRRKPIPPSPILEE